MDYTEKITHLFNVPAEHAVPIASFVNSLGVDGVRASASGSDLILTRRIAGGSCDDGDKWKAWSDLIDAIFLQHSIVVTFYGFQKPVNSAVITTHA